MHVRKLFDILHTFPFTTFQAGKAMLIEVSQSRQNKSALQQSPSKR